MKHEHLTSGREDDLLAPITVVIRGCGRINSRPRVDLVTNPGNTAISGNLGNPCDRERNNKKADRQDCRPHAGGDDVHTCCF